MQRILFFSSDRIKQILKTLKIIPRSSLISHSTHRRLMHMVLQLCVGFLQVMFLVKEEAITLMYPIHLVNSKSAKHAKLNKQDFLSFIVSMECYQLSPQMESTLNGSSDYRSKVYLKTLLIRKLHFICRILQYLKLHK